MLDFHAREGLPSCYMISLVLEEMNLVINSKLEIQAHKFNGDFRGRQDQVDRMQIKQMVELRLYLMYLNRKL